MQSRKLEGNCSNPTAINICKRRLLTCCYLCTCSRSGLSSSPNHRLSCVIIDQSQYRKFYHTYRYYLRAHFVSHLPILLAGPFWANRDFVWYTIYILYIRADYNDASSGFGLWAKTLRGQQDGPLGIASISSVLISCAVVKLFGDVLTND